MTDETQPHDDKPSKPRHVILLEPKYPLYIAIDASGSMDNRADGLKSGSTRLDYARERMHQLLESAPEGFEAPIRVIQFGTVVTALEALPDVGSSGKPPADATLALDQVRAGESQTCVGALLKHVRIMAGDQPANLVVILDGEPSDGEDYDFAMQQLQKKSPDLGVHFLTIGAHADIAASLGQHAQVAALEETEISFAQLHRFGADEKPEEQREESETPKRPTQPSLPPEPNDEDRAAQEQMAKLDLRNALVGLGDEAPPPKGVEDVETANTDPLPPKPEAEPAPDAAQQPDAHHKRRTKDKHHR